MAKVDINTKMITLLGDPLKQSFAAQMQNCGYEADVYKRQGELIAEKVIGMLGDNPSPYVLTFVIFMLCCVMTNFMSNTATTALMVPIGISIAQGMGADPSAVLMACLLYTSKSHQQG